MGPSLNRDGRETATLRVRRIWRWLQWGRR